MDGTIVAPAELPELSLAGAGNEPSDWVDVVTWIDRGMNRMAALRAQAIEFARGQSLGSTTNQMQQRSFTAEIAAALTISERAAENLIGTSRVLVEALPATMSALAEGSIGYRHAQIMVDQIAGLDQADAAALENAALPLASSCTPPRFERRVRTARERLRPESITERNHRAVESRDVQLEPGRDGMAWLIAHLPAPQAVAIFDRLTTGARAAAARGDGRTYGQLRADQLAAQLLDSNQAASARSARSGDANDAETEAEAHTDADADLYRGIRATVVVTIPALTLLGRSDEGGTLEGYGPIDPETARILSGGASSFIRLLTHPETGAALSVGRRRYAVPHDLRTWLRVRDGTCRFIGCGRSAAHCDIDHSREWQHGGGTDHDNLAHLCRRHHRLKGETAWSVTQLDAGALRWTSPGGRTYESTPETEFAATG